VRQKARFRDFQETDGAESIRHLHRHPFPDLLRRARAWWPKQGGADGVSRPRGPAKHDENYCRPRPPRRSSRPASMAKENFAGQGGGGQGCSGNRPARVVQRAAPRLAQASSARRHGAGQAGVGGDPRAPSPWDSSSSWCSRGGRSPPPSLNNDFSCQLAQHSRPSLPVHNRLAASWGSHEGSMLLGVDARRLPRPSASLAPLPESQSPRAYRDHGAQLDRVPLFILTTSNPFERLLPPAQTAGP